MWTFFIALALLIGGYLIYSRVAEKVFVIDGRKTPAMSCPDGVDITPMPKWKSFLIELLNFLLVVLTADGFWLPFRRRCT